MNKNQNAAAYFENVKFNEKKNNNRASYRHQSDGDNFAMQKQAKKNPMIVDILEHSFSRLTDSNHVFIGSSSPFRAFTSLCHLFFCMKQTTKYLYLLLPLYFAECFH